MIAYDRALKRAVADVVLTTGPGAGLVQALQQEFPDVIGLRANRIAPLEVSLAVVTEHHGTHYFRLIVKGEL